MRQLAAVILALILGSAGLWAKNGTQEASQTARQALMEMFFSKESGTFLKHLPAATRATLEKIGSAGQPAAVFRARRTAANTREEFSDI